MPSAWVQINQDDPRFLQCKEVLGYAGLSCADGRNNVTASGGAVRCQVTEDFVSRSVAKSRDGSLDVGGPCVVVRLGDPWHGTILADHGTKRKTGSLDDTLSIFDNSSYSFATSWLARNVAATRGCRQRRR